MRKTLMKTPINGARLSSSFGKRNINTWFYKNAYWNRFCPQRHSIMASGDGLVVRAKWCGGN